MLSKIGEYIWPVLNGEPPAYSNFLGSDTEIKLNSNSVNFALEMYKQQQDRVVRIESKSVVFLGFFGAVIAIISFIIKDILLVENKGVFEYLTMLSLSIVVIYVLQIMRYSIKSLQRQSYHSMSEKDFLNKSEKEFIIELINKIKRNYDVINLKVDYMTMAQEFCLRVIYILLFLMLALAIISIFNIWGEFNFEIPRVC